MTNHSRSAPSPTLPLAAPMAAYPAPLMMAVMLVPFPIMGAAFTLPSAMYPAAAAPTSAPSVAPAPEAAPAKSAPAAPPAAAPPAPAAPAPRNPGAGLPAPLVALLRDEAGPFLANQEEVAAPEWYAITRGRFVGVVDQYALSAVAISGVGHGARKAYTTQGLALDAFNRALEWGGVQVA
ncbi:hypothetical protein C8R47DRAFT_1231423 [Mycena vitilis]|nr:hypothetical protein C8R47DRAFT_1231423 [Mycena vitilis]